jgi:beta-lactamase class A
MKKAIFIKDHPFRWLVVGVLFIAGFVTGIISDRAWIGKEKNPPKFFEVREGGFKFINPLLECEESGAMISDQEVRPFQKKIKTYINEVMYNTSISEVSVYFRDLTNGPAFGVNEDIRFAPASLFKVPTMIAYFKLAETHPDILKKKLFYDGKHDLNKLEHFKSSHAIEPGREYTIEELIKMTIQYSDDNANRLLYENIDPAFMQKVYEDLCIAGSNFIGRNFRGDFVTVEEYTSCFRFLFNSSYLSRDLSERALRYLTESEFSYGIRGGVPLSIPVAHKHGERVIEGTDVKELHDCGIIYYPTMPYLLCVMTKGTDFDVMAETLKNVSALVYSEIDKNQAEQQAEKGRVK